MDLQRALTQAKATGMLWICGEMAFPINQGPCAAYTLAYDIAEQCGYLVEWKNRSHTAFSICGGDIVGYVACDWYDGEVIAKVEHWMCRTVWI